ncbi:MAG: hypothetical protein ABI193_00980, partial [Minicystis sp.]
ALAHRHICEGCGVQATIAHVHPVAHRENRALLKLLRVEMLQVARTADLARFRYLSLVDCTAPEPSIELPPDLTLLTVVDHHRRGEVEAPFVDVRPEIGASSSIYAQYLERGPFPLQDQHRDDTRIATALLFGIQTDTDDYALATAADFAAASYVRAFCDTDVLKQVGRRIVSASAMDVLRRALDNLVVVRDIAVSGVGDVSVSARDAIGTAADFILRREDIDTVIVFGMVGDRLDGSLRTNNPSVDPAQLLRTAFGCDREGRFYGGGRADKGGFQIELGALAGCSDRKALWTLAEELVLTKLGVVVPDLTHERRPT